MKKSIENKKEYKIATNPSEMAYYLIKAYRKHLISNGLMTESQLIANDVNTWLSMVQSKQELKSIPNDVMQALGDRTYLSLSNDEDYISKTHIPLIQIELTKKEN